MKKRKMKRIPRKMKRTPIKLKKIIDGVWTYKGYVINRDVGKEGFSGTKHGKFTMHHIFKGSKLVTKRKSLQIAIETIDNHIHRFL